MQLARTNAKMIEVIKCMVISFCALIHVIFQQFLFLAYEDVRDIYILLKHILRYNILIQEMLQYKLLLMLKTNFD